MLFTNHKKNSAFTFLSLGNYTARNVARAVLLTSGKNPSRCVQALLPNPSTGYAGCLKISIE